MNNFGDLYVHLASTHIHKSKPSEVISHCCFNYQYQS